MQLISTKKEIFHRLYNTVKVRLDYESRKLFKNSSWVFIGNVIFLGGVFAQSVILSRMLGVKLYGTFILIIYLVETSQEFLNINFSSATIKYISEYKSANDLEKIVAFLKGTFYFVGISAIVSILVIVLIVFCVYDIFIKQPRLEAYIIAYGVGRSFSFFDAISYSLLQAYDKFRLSSSIRIFSAFTELTFVVIAITVFPKQLTMLFVAVLSARLIGSIASNGVAIWVLRGTISRYFHVKLSILHDQWKEIRNFILSQSVSRTLRVLISRGDVLILGTIAGPVQVGYYAVAKKLAFSFALISDPMANAVFPQLASLSSLRRYRDIKIMLKKISKILLFPIILFFIGGSLFSKCIMKFIYGKEYIAAGKPFLFLLMTVCIAAFFFWLSPLILSFGRAVFKLKIDAIIFVIGALVAFLLASSYGAVGVAMAMLTVYLISHSIFLYVTVRTLK